MAKFVVTADKFWHSTECRLYKAGDVIELPDSTKTTETSSVQPFKEPKPKAQAKGEDIA
jgi:hypothetical protein